MNYGRTEDGDEIMRDGDFSDHEYSDEEGANDCRGVPVEWYDALQANRGENDGYRCVYSSRRCQAGHDCPPEASR